MNLFSKLSILFLVGVASCKEEPGHQPVTSDPMVKDIGTVRLSDLEGHPINLAQYKGKTVFINFWATWCKPCLAEMPSIQKTQEILKEKNIEFILASDETAEQIQRFREQHNFGFHFARVENMEELGIMALPTTFIFNPGGKLTFSEMGYRQWDDKKNIDLILNIAGSK